MSSLTALTLLLLLTAMSVISGRSIIREKNIINATALGGTILIIQSICIMVAMHYLKIPIKAATLIPVYISIATITTIFHTISCRKMPWQITSDITGILLPGLAIFTIMILPYTHFTGIDTYKWQDLATAINIEQNIPWLIHPLSLLGFTPRSYPSAQPIMLATIQIMGNLGIESGFAVISIFTAIIGCSAAYLLGLKAFDKPRHAAIFALLYIYTPVFTRYTHWATGRGLFLAILPLTLAIFIKNKKTPHSTLHTSHFTLQTSNFKLLPPLILLPLCHKAGFVMLIATIPLLITTLIIPKNSNRTTIIISIIPFAILALAIVHPAILPIPLGNTLGIIRTSITRFGLLIPLALYGLIAPKNLFASIRWRGLYPLMLLSIPLAFERQMYGALIAAPMISLAATQPITQLLNSARKHHRSISLAFIIYLLAFSSATIIHRSRIATPDRIYHAAQFLEKYDPQGPFALQVPGRARTQIQAYVSGCPRFNINTSTNSTIHFNSPPTLKGRPRDTLRNWITYARGFITIPETSTDWYGKNPRIYYITIDQKGSHPPDTSIIYNQNNIRIYTTIQQPQ